MENQYWELHLKDFNTVIANFDCVADAIDTGLEFGGAFDVTSALTGEVAAYRTEKGALWIDRLCLI